MNTGDAARTCLAGIRIFNGAIGLFAAVKMATSVGGDLTQGTAFVYPARMFGIRTLVLGVDLLRLGTDEAGSRRVLREAVLIHATDTAATAYAGARGELSPKAAKLTTTISAINTVLAITALVATPPRRDAEK